MKTVLILLAQYETAVIPLDIVCKDYFQHLTPTTFMRKSLAGEIKLPVVRIDEGQKATRGIMLSDLAQWIDDRRADAVRELERIHG
ncbi:Pyocin activator protein PrtN [Aminobacter sp. MSH1]|uniref:pyocin activator PrtN family protein n=1 Tax=Aminobacter sp. MSH1 TaxID=374606 RepID=UPI000D3B2747|nr:pyocin activator PrtN family protein [Aminobacter sp. MSH1]AWC21805.1 Pyocin activator protein PrtN [Aminobacter sp. MSH1]